MCVIVHSSLKTPNIRKQTLQNDKNRIALNKELINRGANANEVYFSRGRKYIFTCDLKEFRALKLFKCIKQQHVTLKHCPRQLRPIVTHRKENFLPASISFPAPYLVPSPTLPALLLNPFHSTGHTGMWARERDRASEESSADVIRSHRFFRVSTLIKKIKHSLVAMLSVICITSSNISLLRGCSQLRTLPVLTLNYDALRDAANRIQLLSKCHTVLRYTN